MDGRTVLLFFLILISCGALFAGEPDNPFTRGENKVVFTENKGQVHDQHNKARPDVLFGGNAGGMTFHLRRNGISYQLQRVDSWREEDPVHIPRAADDSGVNKNVPDRLSVYRIDIDWPGCNSDFEVEKGDSLPGYGNYYHEVCPNGVHFARTYTGVSYKNIYNGIDVRYYEKDGVLKYDYVVRPGADYKQISLQVKGARRIILLGDGSVLIRTPLGSIVEEAPQTFQEGRKIKSRWMLEGDTLSFVLADHDPDSEIVIDPGIRVWGTYYGATGSDSGMDCAVDGSGNVYMVGTTGSASSTLIATTGAYQSQSGGGSDAFIVKFDQNGVRLWATYYGGVGNEGANSCATDGAGGLFICGSTSSASTVMATGGSHQSVYGGGTWDTFLARFNGAGVRSWSTYYGGSDFDSGILCRTDAGGNVFLFGGTESTNGIATLGAHQTTQAGSFDLYVAKFNAAGARQWATYYGSAGSESADGMAVSPGGDVFISGGTQNVASSAVFATSSCHQGTYGGGLWDFFLAKFNTNGVRQWGTFYGASGAEYESFCATDQAGNVYLAGHTTSNSTLLVTPGCHQPVYGGFTDAILVKFNANGVRQWATYYGGNMGETGFVTASAGGDVFLWGRSSTTSSPAIASPGSHQTANAGGYDAYLAKFSSAGVRQWGTFYGGPGLDFANAVVADAASVYLCGHTSSTANIASAGSHQDLFAGAPYDGFLVKFTDCEEALVTNTTPLSGLAICAGNHATLSAAGNGTITWYASATSTVTLSIAQVYQTPTLAPGTVTYFAELTNSCAVTAVRVPVTVTVYPAPVISTSGGSVCAGDSFTIIPSGASTYTFSSGSNVVSPAVTTVYSVTGTSSEGCTAQVPATLAVSVIPLPVPVIGGPDSICAGQTAFLFVTGVQSFTWNTGAVSPLISISPAITATYSIQGENPEGCKATASLTVHVTPAPVLTVNDITTCATAPATLLATSLPAVSFSWFPGSLSGNSVVVNPSSTTLYTVEATLNGCKTSTHVIVQVNPISIPQTLFSYLPACSSQQDASPQTVTGFDEGGVFYSEVVDVDPVNGNVVLAGVEPGSYEVTYYLEQKGCRLEGKHTATLLVLKSASLGLQPQVTVQAGSSVTLTASGAGSFSWTPPDWLSCTHCPDPVASPPHDITYCVHDPGNSCITETCIHVVVQDASCTAGQLTVPNAFTPNNDGNNDFLVFDGWQSCVNEFTIMIYDRWGEKVFESSDAGFRWDGSYKGKMLDSEVLVYVMKSTLANGVQTERKGNITLIR